jgi:hypothetical protein
MLVEKGTIRLYGFLDTSRSQSADRLIVGMVDLGGLLGTFSTTLYKLSFL